MKEMVAVVIALLAVLGVNVAVLVVMVIAALGRRKWVRDHRGSFGGVARAVSGHPEGFGSRPRRGYGRWVHDVMVWTPAPLFLRNALAPIEGVVTHAAEKHLRRLGDNPIVVVFESGSVQFEIATRAKDRDRALGPFAVTRPVA
jgi:hypothetical protein